MQKQGKIIAALAIAVTVIFVLLMFQGGPFRKSETERSTLTDEDAALRYPYQTLNPKERALYATLYQAMSEHRENVRLPYRYSGEEYERVYLMIRMQEPQFFYVADYYQLSPVMTETEIQYDLDMAKCEEMTEELEKAADQIIDDLKYGDSDLEKLLDIHDAIAKGCMYYQVGYSAEAYGCLVKGNALCEGYAKAFTYVARRAGLEAFCVSGISANGEAHVWNIFQTGGKYYNVDVTWDDEQMLKGTVSHRYFAVSDERFAKHRADLSCFEPPACTGDDKQYYINHGMILNELSQLALKANEWAAQVQNSSRVIEFYCTTPAVYQSAIEDIKTGNQVGGVLASYTETASFRYIADPEGQIITIIF